jgi:putative nucleotidyltransferase with HDIG domain
MVKYLMNRIGIDILHIKKVFDEYTRDYLKYGDRAHLKIIHTYNVVDRASEIAHLLDMNDEDVLLAQLIAFLHDIGRFEQLKRFNTFEDSKSINHAALSVEILFKDGLIREFIETDEYDSIIADAVANHNKFEISKDIKGKSLIHCKLIRDADKLDIFRVKIETNAAKLFPYIPREYNGREITDSIFKDFMNNKVIKKEERITFLDFEIGCIAFIYDFNFISSLKYIKDHNYINILIDKLVYKKSETKDMLESIRNHALKYINLKLENER